MLSYDRSTAQNRSSEGLFMAPLIAFFAFLAFFVLLAVASMAGLGADSRTYRRWSSAADQNHTRPRAE
jgi:hypothetical protein